MKMIYKPGKMLNLRGVGSVDYKTVEDDAELESGWYESPQEAVESKEVAKTSERIHLETKAKELGIGFNARTTDETLIERINEAE